MDGVLEQGDDALQRVRKIRELQDQYRRKLHELGESENSLRLVEELFASPVMTAPRAARLLNVSNAGAMGILKRLTDAEVVEEISGMWPRHFVARELLNAIEKPAAHGKKQ